MTKTIKEIGYTISEFDEYEFCEPEVIVLTHNPQDAIDALVLKLRNHDCPVNGEFYKKEATRLERNRHRIINGKIDGLHMQYQIKQIEIIVP